jgi:hypothetical protein
MKGMSLTLLWIIDRRPQTSIPKLSTPKTPPIDTPKQQTPPPPLKQFSQHPTAIPVILPTTVAPQPNIPSPITSLPAVLPKPQLPSGVEPDIVTSALDAQTSNDSPLKITAIIVAMITCLVVITGMIILYMARVKCVSSEI